MLSRVIFNGLKNALGPYLELFDCFKWWDFRPFLSIKSTLSSQSQWNPFSMKKMVNAATKPGDKSSRNIVKARQVSIMAYHVRSIRFSVSAWRRVPKNILEMNIIMIHNLWVTFMSHLPFLITWQGGKLKQMLVYIKSALTVMILSNEQRLDKTVSFASRHL